MKALINKETLNMICQTKGVSPEFLCKKCNMKIEKVKKVLSVDNEELPAFGKAKTIAEKLHVPFAGLYMNPEDLPLYQIKKYKIRNFRTTINAIEGDSLVNIAVHDLLEYRDALIDVNQEIGEKPINYKDIYMPSDLSIEKWSTKIRSIFDICIEEQYKMLSTRKFYIYLRNRIEKKNIFVSAFAGVPIEVVRGIAIYDSKMPIIGININDRYPGMSFSLIHELVHILRHTSSTCNEMTTFTAREEEVFCNAVAGECLVPYDTLKKQINMTEGEYSIDEIEKYAKLFSVSKEMFTRRLLDCGIIEEQEYKSIISRIEKQLLREKEKRKEEAAIAKAAGQQYGFPKRQELAAIDRRSTRYCEALYEGFCNDIFSKQDLARGLNIKQKNVSRFINEVSTWNN